MLRYVKWFWCSIPLVQHKYDKSRWTTTTTNENNQQNVTLFITGGKFNWQQTRADPPTQIRVFCLRFRYRYLILNTDTHTWKSNNGNFWVKIINKSERLFCAWLGQNQAFAFCQPPAALVATESDTNFDKLSARKRRGRRRRRSSFQLTTGQSQFCRRFGACANKATQAQKKVEIINQNVLSKSLAFQLPPKKKSKKNYRAEH